MEPQPDIPSHPHSKTPVRQLFKSFNLPTGLSALHAIGLLFVLVMVASGNTDTSTHPVVQATEEGVHTASVMSIAFMQTASAQPKPAYWHPPTNAQLPAGAAGREVSYGRELIAHTANYLGPNGSVQHLSNGMNCQNCHLDAGTKALGNNYSAVASTYPKLRARSGHVEDIVTRISDCFERSLNGRGPSPDSREMKAIVAYIQWLGTGVSKGERPQGVGLAKLPYLDRAADPTKGKLLYAAKCQSCHGTNGGGIKMAGKVEYTYPPLWGPYSYNDGAGLFRLSNFAGYIKNNMPYGISYENPMLTDEESWDLAAFVNSMPRPHKDQHKDWPNLATKSVDFPSAPYTDSFSARQHKFGPYQPIANAKKKADRPIK